MSQKSWTAAARKFRASRNFPRNWRRVYPFPFYMALFSEGFLQGYNASNEMHAKKRKGEK